VSAARLHELADLVERFLGEDRDATFDEIAGAVRKRHRDLRIVLRDRERFERCAGPGRAPRFRRVNPSPGHSEPGRTRPAASTEHTRGQGRGDVELVAAIRELKAEYPPLDADLLRRLLREHFATIGRPSDDTARAGFARSPDDDPHDRDAVRPAAGRPA
jgi:hypothetical protein